MEAFTKSSKLNKPDSSTPEKKNQPGKEKASKVGIVKVDRLQ